MKKTSRFHRWKQRVLNNEERLRWYTFVDLPPKLHRKYIRYMKGINKPFKKRV